jgi:hypothetical protein
VTGDQIEYSLMAAAGLFCTLVGAGWIDIGLPAKNRATMRWAGPVVLICGLLLLAHAFWP